MAKLIGIYVIGGLLFLIPSFLVVLILRGQLKRRNRPRVWEILLFLCVVWCAAAVWEGVNIWKLLESPRYLSGWYTSEVRAIRIPIWLTLLAPSFAALMTVFWHWPRYYALNVREGVSRFVRSIAGLLTRLGTGRYRVYLLAAVVILLALLARLFIWLVGPQ